ncbi:MAG: arginine deiminase family protein, partial [Phycisphaerae bacterium]
MRFRIDNEYDKLEAVLVHRPGGEIDRLTHDNMRRFLFEDVPFLRRMKDEHDAFVEKLRERHVEVLFLEALLREVLEDETSRREVVTAVCDAAAAPAIADDLIGLRFWNMSEVTELL